MKMFTTVTGYGIFKDPQGRVRGKYELPKGEHPMSEMSWEAQDVPGPNELDSINVDEVLTPAQQAERDAILANETKRQGAKGKIDALGANPNMQDIKAILADLKDLI